MTYPHTKDWLTAPDLAREAGVSENTARRWIKQHALGRKVGGRWRANLTAAGEFVALPLKVNTSPETSERR
jgi:transposase-like protein